MYLMVDIKDRCVRIIPKPPHVIFQLGHCRRVFSHLNHISPGNWKHPCELPLVPDSVCFRVGLLPCNGASIPLGVKCPIELLNGGFQV